MKSKNRKPKLTARPSRGRHEYGCLVCAHPQRDEIEREFISWKSPAKISSAYKLRNRASVYRHAHALDLFAKRARNIRAALERIIEQVDGVQVNAASVVQAITAYARINAEGQLVERRDQLSVHDLFARMSAAELNLYATEGKLPEWFIEATGAAVSRTQEAPNND